METLKTLTILVSPVPSPESDGLGAQAVERELTRNGTGEAPKGLRVLVTARGMSLPSLVNSFPLWKGGYHVGDLCVLHWS